MTSTLAEAAAKIETAKHAKEAETERRIAKLEENDAALQKIVPALHVENKKLKSEMAKLKRLIPKPSGAKTRAGKVPKKKG